MKNSTLLIALIAFTPLAVFCQPTDFNSIVQPVDVKAREFPEYLVQLAWLNRPESAIAQTRVKRAGEKKEKGWFDKPAKKQSKQRALEIAQQQVNQKKLELRAETLTRYATLRLSREILKTRTLVEQEAYNNYILIQQLYRTDEKGFDEYATASSLYFQAQEARIRAEGELQIAQLRLEEMIGLKWEQVQHPGKE